MTLVEEVNIYRNLLVTLHTWRWTGHHDKVVEILDKIGQYSYARTNSFECSEEEDEERLERTLKALDL